MSTRRVWFWRVFLGIVLPLALLVVAEAGLRVFGVGFSTKFWVPGGEPGTVQVNLEFARHFSARKNPSRPFFAQFAARKPAGTVRVFLLGESAAFGTPDPAYGPARLLQVMMEEQYPDRQVEVINAALMGIDSFVLRRIAQDCAQYDPDLFIIFTGNNELIGLHAPSADSSEISLNYTVARLSDWCKSTRLGQMARRAMTAAHPPPVQDMGFLRRQRRLPEDPLLAKARKNFHANLDAVCRLGQFPKIIATVPVNVRDFPPLASLHRSGMSAGELKLWNEAFNAGLAEEQARRYANAIVNYQTAAALDRQYAELHYRLGRCFLAVECPDKAREHLRLARDLDALPFRASRQINEILRILASAHGKRGILLCDLEEAFAAHPSSRHQMPGRELFYEHVHTTFTGTHLIAAQFSHFAGHALSSQLGPPPASGPLAVEECARRLAFTRLEEYNVAQAMSRLCANPPFIDQADHAFRMAEMEREVSRLRQLLTNDEMERVLATYYEAIRRRPEDWALRFNLGSAYLQMGKHVEAASTFAWLVKAYPEQYPFQMVYGKTLLALGRADEAHNHLAYARKLAPHAEELRGIQ